MKIFKTPLMMILISFTLSVMTVTTTNAQTYVYDDYDYSNELPPYDNNPTGYDLNNIWEFSDTVSTQAGERYGYVDYAYQLACSTNYLGTPSPLPIAAPATLMKHKTFFKSHTTFTGFMHPDTVGVIGIGDTTLLLPTWSDSNYMPYFIWDNPLDAVTAVFTYNTAGDIINCVGCDTLPDYNEFAQDYVYVTYNSPSNQYITTADSGYSLRPYRKSAEYSHATSNNIDWTDSFNLINPIPGMDPTVAPFNTQWDAWYNTNGNEISILNSFNNMERLNSYSDTLARYQLYTYDVKIYANYNTFYYLYAIDNQGGSVGVPGQPHGFTTNPSVHSPNHVGYWVDNVTHDTVLLTDTLVVPLLQGVYNNRVSIIMVPQPAPITPAPPAQAVPQGYTSANNGNGGLIIEENDDFSNSEYDRYGKSSGDIHISYLTQNITINNRLDIPGDTKIYDINGKLMKQVSINSSNATIDISGLQSGMYILRVKDEEGTLRWKFVIP